MLSPWSDLFEEAIGVPPIYRVGMDKSPPFNTDCCDHYKIGLKYWPVYRKLLLIYQGLTITKQKQYPKRYGLYVYIYHSPFL